MHLCWGIRSLLAFYFRLLRGLSNIFRFSRLSVCINTNDARRHIRIGQMSLVSTELWRYWCKRTVMGFEHGCKYLRLGWTCCCSKETTIVVFLGLLTNVLAVGSWPLGLPILFGQPLLKSKRFGSASEGPVCPRIWIKMWVDCGCT